MIKKNRVKSPPTKKTKRLTVPDLEDLPNPNSLRPVFSFHHMRYGEKYCLSGHCKDLKVTFSDRLLRISQLTWGQLASESKRGLGYEFIPRHRFKVSLPQTVTPEVRIIIFRIDDKARMAGFRTRDVYHIALIGSDHELY